MDQQLDKETNTCNGIKNKIEIFDLDFYRRYGISQKPG
jgi:hypothetical protein